MCACPCVCALQLPAAHTHAYTFPPTLGAGTLMPYYIVGMKHGEVPSCMHVQMHEQKCVCVCVRVCVSLQEWEEAWEWLTVTRPDPTSPNHTLTLRIPTGSVRASLGWGSRFEDAHALVSFIHKHYSGRHSNASSMESLRLYEAEQSTGGEAPGRGSSGSRRMGPVIQMGQDVDWLRKRLVYNRAGGC